jgi:DNA invertase Pin-like site-specific DNA recombinase
MPTQSTAPIPCVIYAARSREDARSDEEKSTTSQTEEVRSAIESLGGREVVGEFSESGHSGFHGERGPELVAATSAAKAAAKAAGVEAELWVFHSSRLARGSGEKGKQSLMKIWSDLKYEDVQVRSATDDEFVINPMLVSIASTQNHKAGKDISDHVSRGKRAAVKVGKWTGGPAPDGYWLRKVVVNNAPETLLKIDAERRPIIDLIYDLSEEGIGDATIARRLNGAGHRTRKGKAWSRRLVQYIVTHPVYAGRIVRVGEGSHKGGTYRKLDTPEVYDGRHEAIIDPDRWDRINAKRAERDRSRAGREKAKTQRDKAKLGGAPTTRYLLTKLAYCPRCEERMLCKTDPYVRKDGTRKRNYVCPNKLGSTGTCDMPRIDASRLDAVIWVYLNDTFVDVGSWAQELQRGLDEKRTALESAVAHEVAEAAKAERLREKAQARYRKLLAEDADPTRAEDLMAELDAEIGGARDRAATAQERLNSLDAEEAPTDVALDFYIDLAAAIEGAKESESVQTVNEKLRETFVAFYPDVDDDGALTVRPVLQARPEMMTLSARAEAVGHVPLIAATEARADRD